MRLSLDPAVIALLLGATGLYLRAVRVLGRRGYRVPVWQQVAWYSGVGLTAVALLSPIDGLGEDLLSAHMGQHLLLADLSAPLLLTGLRTPVLQSYLPPAILVPLARQRGLRRFLRRLRRPLVAIGIYVLILYGWHFAFAFEAGLRNDLLHAVQHESFLLGSVLVWWPALEPERARLRGELWKIGHILGARLAGMFLGMAFILMSSPAYEGFYGDAAREHGLRPLLDQQIAGGMMLGVDLLTMLFALGFFFWKAGVEHDRRSAALADEARSPGPAAPEAHALAGPVPRDVGGDHR
jgi:putative membrane protein